MSWLNKTLRAIYNFFYETLLGCSHSHLTRPFTLETHSYKVCLDCGKHFPYSLEKMRTIHPWESASPRPQVAELNPAVSIATGFAEVSGYAEAEDYGSTQAIA